MHHDTAPESPRVRSVTGSHNVRDLGGLATGSGGVVRTGRVFRSDYPAFVDLDAAHGLDLRTVVDLRRGTESLLECVDWAQRGVRYFRWPLTAGRESSWRASYTSYLAHRPETVVGAVREVLRPEGHPVLFHCAAGKDRTGVVAALLLAVLGVRDEDIVEDYVLSESSVAQILHRLRGHQLYADMLAGSSVQDQHPRAEQMWSVLTWLEDHGGADQWLMSHGVTPTEIAAFRSTMLGSPS